MRAAPVVHADLSRGAFERFALALIHGFVGAVWMVWVGSHGEWSALVTLTSTAALCIAMFVLGWQVSSHWLPDRQGRLSWDGQAWRWIPSLSEPALDVPGVFVQVHLDTGQRKLLRLSDGRSVNGWVIASCVSAGAAWHGLCVALAAHAGSPGAHQEAVNLAGKPQGHE
jgi:hypothetical protein